ncbi:MAG: metallophosphoesterase family protein [Robiginitalea sp.]|nr:metallophosphoesterase family protein [Robiginitalea sp.]
MKQFAIGDIHGGLRALEEVLQKVDPQPEDQLIFLGDYVDGWSEAAETIDFLISLRERQPCLFLRGNHDDLCLQWLREGRSNPLWLQSGGEATQQSYAGIGQATRKAHIRFLQSLEDYYLDTGGRLFLHAGFTNLKGVRHEYFPKNFYWDRTLWETALSLNPSLKPEDSHYPARLKLYREIFIGHTPVTRLGQQRPYQAANVWNVDTGAAFKGPLSVLEVGSKSIWQSQPVHLHYPGEQGRN